MKSAVAKRDRRYQPTRDALEARVCTSARKHAAGRIRIPAVARFARAHDRTLHNLETRAHLILIKPTQPFACQLHPSLHYLILWPIFSPASLR